MDRTLKNKIRVDLVLSIFSKLFFCKGNININICLVLWRQVCVQTLIRFHSKSNPNYEMQIKGISN